MPGIVSPEKDNLWVRERDLRCAASRKSTVGYLMAIHAHEPNILDAVSQLIIEFISQARFH